MRSTASVALLLLALAPGGLHAQRFGGAPVQRGWPPVTVGIRAGYDYNSTGSLVGAQARVAALPSGFVEVVPNGEITFLNGLREYQYGVDAVVVSGGRSGGIYAGGGIAWRSTIYEGPDRETRRAPTVVVGARSSALFGSPFGTQIEMRWTFPEGDFKPRSLTLGVNFPLWGRGGR
ncbi:MAG: hypothetical protein AMXMBFR53_25950 [Gemmatimonadota bacterium]